MVGNYFHIVQMSDAILAAVSNAAHHGEPVHTGKLAKEMAAKYPNCGMALREIEDEIIRQVGLARGVAEIAHEPAQRRTG